MAQPDPTPWPIDHVLRGDRHAVALEDRAGALTYDQAEDAVARMAGWLAGLGLPVGARVASWLPKTREACLLPLAAPRAGLVHVPINPVLKRAQVAHILADSGAALLLSQPGRIATLQPGDIAAGVVVPDAIGVGDPVPRSTADPDALAAILYTSGSTGRPKGVMLSHANLWLGAISVAHYLGLAADDRTLAVLPLAFDYGQNQLLSTWAAGSCAIGFDYLLPKDVVRAVRRHDVTVLAGVPPLWLQLAEQKWEDAGSTLRILTNSGGHLPEPL
ncbi:MAG TPA: AMP-binding protein, partial [Sphingomonas sp.]|nr:AMP-binding protein [Sphingomonas sp.]